MRRMVWAGVLGLTLPMLLACAGVGSLLESAEVKRAKAAIAASSFEMAATDLAAHLRNKPDDAQAKSLLAFADLARQDPQEITSAAPCMLLQPTQSPPAEVTTAQEALRQRAIARGLLTKDWAEYAAILQGAIAYGWGTHLFPDSMQANRALFAYCAAVQGDTKAADTLVQLLQNDSTTDIAKVYLYLLGEPSAAALQSAAASGGPNKEKLEDALRLMRLGVRLGEFARAHADRTQILTIRTGSSKVTPGKFLMKSGWRDNNKELKKTMQAVQMWEAPNRVIAGDAEGQHKEKPLVVRLLNIEDEHFAVFMVARPATGLEEAQAGEEGWGLEPAGKKTAFVNQVFQWRDGAWQAMPIDGLATFEGPDKMVLGLSSAKQNDQLERGEVSFLVYRGLMERQEVASVSWLGNVHTRSVKEPRIEQFIFDVKPGGLQFDRATNLDGWEVLDNGITAEGMMDMLVEEDYQRSLRNE